MLHRAHGKRIDDALPECRVLIGGQSDVLDDGQWALPGDAAILRPDEINIGVREVLLARIVVAGVAGGRQGLLVLAVGLGLVAILGLVGICPLFRRGRLVVLLAHVSCVALGRVRIPGTGISYVCRRRRERVSHESQGGRRDCLRRVQEELSSRRH